MEGHDINSQATPFNINEPYANKLITIIAAVIAFLTARNVVIYIYSKTKTLPRLHSTLTPIAEKYTCVESYIINKFSFTALYGNCPPVGAILITLALVCAILPLLLLNVDLAVNSNRAGFLCLAIVPFLLSSTGKNSALSLLTGISSIKLNFLHRILGLALFICATVHMSTMLYSWSKFPSFMQSQLQLSKVQYGLAGYACLCVVVLGSFLPIRIFCYEAFVVTHLFGIAFIGVIAVHTAYAMRYFMAGLVCYLLNLVAVWFVKTYVAQARFEVLPEGCTKISIRLGSPMKSHYIGQHINLCIPSISPFQWHPFTITSVQQKNSTFQNSIEVCVCARGNFTRTLYRRVDPSQDLRVFVSGPFGSSSIRASRVLEDYSSVVIASGGAGVTFGMRLLRELTDTLIMRDEEAPSNHCKTENIYFSWCVRRPAELEWFRQELEQMNYIYDVHTEFPRLHVKLHVTGQDMALNTVAADESGLVKETLEANDTNKLFEDKYSGKKDVEVVFGRRVDAKALLSVDKNVGAFVCGPKGFNALFKNTVAISKSNAHLHCEDFGY